jgi:Na+/H+-dicarboxylate symporter
MRKGLTWLVFLGTCLGVIFGLACHALLAPGPLGAVTGGLDIITTLFLRAIRMLIAPLVLGTLVSGIGKMGHSSDVGRVAARALGWFLVASLASLAIGFVAVELLTPGAGMHLKGAAQASGITAAPLTLSGFLTDLIPTSLIDAMARNQVLEIAIFAVIAGLALNKIGAKGKILLELAEALAHLMLQTPLAVFAAVAGVLARQGSDILSRYAGYIGGFYLALAILWMVLMAMGAAALGIKRQIALMKTIREPALIAFTTSNSEAAYPSLLYQLEAFGIPNRIVSFMLPLGYSFNLIGSMCYCVFAVLFIAQAYDVALSTSQMVQLMLLLFVLSKGIASVSRAALLVILAVLPYLHLPEGAVLLVLGVDHFMDMGRTCTNVVGVSIATATVAHWEGSDSDKNENAQIGIAAT